MLRHFGNTSALSFPCCEQQQASAPLPDHRRFRRCRAQGTPFQIAELVEHEKWMVARATEVTVVGFALLFAMARAEARVHVKEDHFRRASAMHTVDPRSQSVPSGSGSGPFF